LTVTAFFAPLDESKGEAQVDEEEKNNTTLPLRYLKEDQATVDNEISTRKLSSLKVRPVASSLSHSV
jgi:hypothetical protein